MTGNSARAWMIVLSIMVLGRGPLWAQTAADTAAADSLFDEGKKLIERGDTATACDKFAASLSRATQLGTQIALATCYEKLGKTASAWAAFRAAANAASKAHDRRQQYAEEHAAALATRLSKIVIEIRDPDRVDGLEIRRDGSPVPPAELDTAIPVDPGEHIVEARAPGYVAWSTRLTVPSSPDTVVASVPALSKLAAPGRPKRHGRIVAYSIGAGGIALIGASLVFGAEARSQWNAAQADCFERLCDSAGLDRAHSAATFGNVSTATFVAGVGALAVATYLVLRASSASDDTHAAKPTAIRVAPGLGPTQVGLTIRGGF
jgi:hypothetical protein